MALSPVKIDRFGGLDLRKAPDEGQALDVLNVAFDDDGRIRSRDGWANFSTAPGGGLSHIGIHRFPASTPEVLVGNTDTYALDYTGVLITTAAGVDGRSFTQFGTPTASYTYFVDAGAAPTTIRRWDGALFSAPAGMPTGKLYLAVTPWDNRLAAAGHYNSASGLHRVDFSDEGAPETWPVNNYVNLGIGEGDFITGMVAWQNYLFVFKKRKYFVFYGTTADADGFPEFQWRTIDTGIGHVAYRQPPVAAPEGVYFISPKGVHLTTGGPPQLVSAPLTPIFEGRGLSPFYTAAGYIVTPITGSMVHHRGRLHVSFTASETYVYEPSTGAWTVHGFGLMNGATSVTLKDPSSDGPPDLLFSTNVASIGKHNQSYTTDNGTAITSRYRSSFQDFGEISEKSIRETLLDGTGTPSFAWSRDWGSLGSSQAVTLGTSPALSQGRHRVAVRGRLLSWQVSATTPWSLQKMAPLIRSQRHVGAYA